MANELVLYCTASVFSTVFVVLGIQRMMKSMFKPRSPKMTKDYPKDTVLLHQFGKGKYAPSLSPFPIKLETYLRMAKIPYKNIYNSEMGSKGKIPWIEYNGVDVPDSQLAIEYLNKQRNVNLDQQLTLEQKAVGRAFLKMVEENLYWSLVWWRWVQRRGEDLVTLGTFPRRMIRLLVWSGRVHDQVAAQGMGRHSPHEIAAISRDDVKAIAAYLGDKQFLMGSEPSEVDCAVFGMLSQLLWHMPDSPHEQMVKKEFPNLRDYCYRMKEKFWPDWDQFILSSAQTAATDKKRE